MAKKLILHIGVWKTATTTIQKELFRNRLALKADGVYYPGFQANCTFLLHKYKKNLVQHTTVKQSKKSLDAIMQDAHRLYDEFITESLGCDVAVLSSEFYLDFSLNEIQRLKLELSELFSEIEIIVYIRDPIKHAISAVNEQVKQGHYRLNEAYDIHSKPTEIERVLLWSDVFGKDNMIVRSFEEAVRIKGGIVRDFKQALNITSEFNSDLSEVETNQSLTLPAVLLSDFLMEKGVCSPREGYIKDFLESIPGPVFSASTTFLDKVKDYSLSTLEKIEFDFGLVFDCAVAKEKDRNITWSTPVICCTIYSISLLDKGELINIQSIAVFINELVKGKGGRIPEVYVDLLFDALRNLSQYNFELNEFSKSRFYALESLLLRPGRAWPLEILKKIDNTKE
jgi:hypothetical protein